VFVGSRKSPLARLIEDVGMGISIEAGDATGFADAVIRLKQNPEERAAMGLRARQWFEKNEFRQASAAWKNLLK